MISVTRMNGSQLYINATMIESLEATPDTVVTMMTGRKFLIKDPLAEICERLTDYYRSIGLVGAIGAIEGKNHWNEVE